jgi:hypothetical protein
MTERCQALWEEFQKATTEWTEAAQAARAFVDMEPLSPGEEIPFVPLGRYDEMAAAYKREDLAHKRYMDTYRAWDECRRNSPR